MFDIASLALADTSTLHLRHPGTKEKLYADEEKTKPVEVIIRSEASKEYRSVMRGIQARTLTRNHKGEKLKVDDVEEEGMRMLIAATAGFNNVIVNGKVPTTEADLRALYSDPKLAWIKAQVNEAVSDYSNFLAE